MKEKLHVIWNNSLPDNIAASVDRVNHILYLSKTAQKEYTSAEYLAVVLHEIGHDELDVDGSLSGEMAADNFAAAALKSDGLSVVPLYTAIRKSYPESHPRIQNIKKQLKDQKIAAFNGQSLSDFIANGHAMRANPGLTNFGGPTAFSWAGLGVNALGVASGFFGQRQQGQDARAVAQAQERIAMQNSQAAIEAARLQAETAQKDANAFAFSESAKNKRILMVSIILAVIIVIVVVALIILKGRGNESIN